MFQPEAYQKAKKLPRSKAKILLDEYFQLINLRPDGKDRILDIGCADAETTVEVILNKFPSKRETIVATDREDVMIEYASKKYANNERISFRKLDVETRDLPKDLFESFDHIFTFFVMHWINDQQNALKNMYKLLKPGGDLFMIFLGKHGAFHAFKEMLKNDKWVPFMSDVPLSLFHYMEHPENYMKDLLLQVGFMIELCKLVDATHFCNFAESKDLLCAVNPALKMLPESSRSEYIDELLTNFFKSGLVKNEGGMVTDNFKLIVVVARKPSTQKKMVLHL